MVPDDLKALEDVTLVLMEYLTTAHTPHFITSKTYEYENPDSAVCFCTSGQAREDLMTIV